MTTIDEKYISRCFQLAKKALGNTSPNPYVGSVIVKEGKVIGEGFHLKSGLAHAEADALNNVSESPAGATLYCNLEPCCHTNKKTAPCCDRIIAQGISKVVIANLDPNPLVAGKGVQKLRDAGLIVTVGILENQGLILNEVFFSHITKKRSFVHLKWAQTLDGKVATNSYDSKWITNKISRENVHKERALYDAILVGANTVNRDDPKLTVRTGTAEEFSTKRIILSASGKLNKSSNVLNDNFKDQTILIVAEGSNNNQGVKCLTCPTIRTLNENTNKETTSFDLNALLKILYKEGICSVYVEGGPTVLKSFIKSNLYDRLSVYIAPKLLGKGIPSVDEFEIESMKDCLTFSNGTWTQFGSDILFQNKRNICLQD